MSIASDKPSSHSHLRQHSCGLSTEQLEKLTQDIKQWGVALGFNQVGIADLDLSQYYPNYATALEQGHLGNMDFLYRNQALREHPDQLQPEAIRVISVRINYLPANHEIIAALGNPNIGYVSRYALGRDYHKLMRKRLKQLGDKIATALNGVVDVSFRPFVDSAPLLERPMAEKAGLGWIGKHTLLLNADEGSLFFLGEILLNVPLPVDTPQPNQCGKCSACIQICPTQAIIAPYQLDARRCISYLTIELDGAIPEPLRPLIGNRIYGCDDCQLVCPWNRLAQFSQEDDFQPRQKLDHSQLLTLLSWNQHTFLTKTQGSAIRRIGFERWQRNLAVALGNAPYSETIVTALLNATPHSDMVQEHLNWAIQRQRKRADTIKSGSTKTARLLRIINKNPQLN